VTTRAEGRGVRPVVVHRPAKPTSPISFLARNAWKLGLGVVVAMLLTSRGAGQTYNHPRVLATNVVPTTVPCGAIKLDSGSTDTATWTAISSPYGTGSPYILPSNDPLLPTTDPSHPNCLKADQTPDDVHVPAGLRLVIDASLGPVQVFSHGTGIFVDGGDVRTINTDPTNTVTFDAEPDVASWDGINISAADASHKGDGSFSYVSVQHALTAFTITSGALSSPDSGSYGLTLRNSGIGPSYFDGIDAANTPISVTGRIDPSTGQSDGEFGTLNNIGSQGIKVTFDPTTANYPAVLPAKSLDVENMTFGSSVPFGETSCPPLTSCGAGTIGNDAIQGTFVKNAQEPVLISNSQFFRAGSYGLELNNPNDPVLTSNTFSHNGIGSAEPAGTCPKNAVNKFPPIYLNNAVVDLENHVTGNFGQQDGLEAIVFNGTVTSSTFTWKTASTDSSKPLGYLLDGDLDMVGGTFKVPAGSVVKAKHGTLNLNGVTLDANDTGVAGTRTFFTSLRDSSVGIEAVCSVFVQSSPPSPLPAGEWGGIDLLAGANASINNATILYATDGVQITDGATSTTLDLTYGPNHGLVIQNSQVGATFFDAISATRTPIAVVNTQLACPVGACNGPSSGHDGVFADFTGSATLGGGLLLNSNSFGGSVDEAVRGVSLGKQTVVLNNNKINGAGTFGIKLEGATNPTVTLNDIRNSGTGTPSYSAIYLPDVVQADFSGSIAGNTGGGNGLNAIVFHGSTANGKPLNWQTVGSGSALGYIVDGDLMVNGDLNLTNGDDAPVLGGTITVKSGTLTATGAIFTSLKQQTTSLPSCGSVFLLKVSGACPPPAPGDWGGLVLDPGRFNAFTSSDIGYAATGIAVGMPVGFRLAENLSLTQTNVHDSLSDGIRSQSPLAVVGGTFSHNGGTGITVDLTGVASFLFQPLTISGHAAVSWSGQGGIRASGLAGQTVQLQDASVDHAGGFGISLGGPDHLTLTNNLVTNSAAGFAAIYLNGFTGAFANVSGNRGAGNGLDALAFHGTVTDDLIWQTARKTGDPSKLLGYLLDNTLTMQPGHTLTVQAGDIVKVGSGGTLDLQGVTLKADDTVSSSQRVFTSLSDNSAGASACPSALLPACSGAAAGDWGGISLSGTGANGALLNASIRYASTGVNITSEAISTSGSSAFGLVVSRSAVGPTQFDGIASTRTAISVTNSTISGGVHGVNADLTGAPLNTALRLSGNRFMSTSAEAILGQALAGQPVWITDNRVQAAGTFGIRLLNADELVLRNNNINNSGGGPSAGAAGYPAVYLNGIVADFTRNVRGNVGSGNGLDVIAFHGTADGDLAWQTPTVNASTAALGYVLDGSLVVNDGTLTVHPGDVVKSLGGPITVSGGTLDASNAADSRPKLFTSLKDQSAYPQTCPSVLTGLCASGPQPGDWGGIVITNDISGRPASGGVVNGQLSFASTALSTDSGPTANFGSTGLGLSVQGTTISDASGDGINAQDTRISVLTSTIQRVGVHGIVATFFGGTPCVGSCGTSLDIEQVSIASSGKDGIVASGLGGRPTVVSDNLVSGAGTYGIRLAGADQLTLNRNTINNSGGPATTFRYPAIYLSGVKADFELTPATTTVAANHGSGNGLDAMVIHGEATQPLTWLTTGVTAPVVVPLVPADHFGYMLDGGLAVDGMLKTNPGDVVKVLGGAIQVNGALVATSTSFTSLKDASVPIRVCAAGYDSVFLQKVAGSCPAAAAGDWAGINAGAASTLTSTTIGFDDGLTVSGGALQFAGGAMHDIAHNAIVVNGSSLSVTNVAFSKVGNDGIDSSNSGSTDTITDDQFDHVNGIAVNLQSSPGDLERNVFTNDANPTVETSGAPVSVQCSSIQSGGIAGDANLTVKESDFAAGVGVTAPFGASTEDNWWGQATGPSGQLAGGLTVGSYFTTQNPTATIAITGKPSATQPLDPVKSDGSLGSGLVQATLTFSRNMSPEATLPSVSYASTPVSFTGAWKLNDPRTWVGSATINASLATNTTHTVSAAGAHDCVPDPSHNLMTPASNTFVADTTTLPTVSTSAADLIGAQSARLHGHIDPAGWATGAGRSGQFVVTNLGTPFDQHLYATAPLAAKTTPLDVTVVASGLQASSTYSVQLQVPSVNGMAIEPTADTVTTTAPASKLVFTSSPAASIQAGTSFSAAATTEDPSGNVVNDFAGNVSVALTVAGGATLSGTLTQPVVNGAVSFGNLSVNKTGSYTLTATSSPALTSAISSSFAIQPGAATQLAFTVQPSGTASAGTAFAQQPVVSVEDAGGNVVSTDSTSVVTLALIGGDPSGTLSCTTNPITLTNGIATFAGCAISTASLTSYQLTATSTSPTLGPVSSSTITVS